MEGPIQVRATGWASLGVHGGQEAGRAVVAARGCLAGSWLSFPGEGGGQGNEGQRPPVAAG